MILLGIHVLGLNSPWMWGGLWKMNDIKFIMHMCGPTESGMTTLMTLTHANYAKFSKILKHGYRAEKIMVGGNKYIIGVRYN